MRARLIIFLAATAVLSAAAVNGRVGERPDDPDAGSQPLKFKAPKTEYEFTDSSFTKSYSGGVYAWQEDVELQAEKALYIGGEAEARFYGGATFKDSLRQVRADTLIYFYENREALAVGDVEVTEKGRLFKSERVLYLKDLNLIEATGGVYIHDDSVRSTITGTKAVFNDSTGYGVITGYPVLIREDEAGSIITITCDDTLEIDRGRKAVHFWNNVLIRKDSLSVSSGRAVYDDSLEVVILTGSPVARHVMSHEPDDAVSEIKTVSTIGGDSMRVYLRERRISGVDVIGAAHSTTVSTDSTGKIYAESIIDSAVMRMVMSDNLISLITAEGTANSYYHKVLQEEDNMFVNEASGDTLYFFFEEGRISHLKIAGAGGAGARGKYYGFKPESETALQDSSGKRD